MSGVRISNERLNYLADIAEMYFYHHMSQAEIAAKIGVTRSMVSRLLTEARNAEVYQIRIFRPLEYSPALETELVKRFGLVSARVMSWNGKNQTDLQMLGFTGAAVLKDYLRPDTILGIVWGKSVAAVVDELEVNDRHPIKVVQLVGAYRAQSQIRDSTDLIRRLSEKLGAEAYFLSAPFMVDQPEVAEALLKTPNIQEIIAIARECTVALLGIGSVDPKYSSYLHGGHLGQKELDILHESGAVGGMAAIHFDLDGNPVGQEIEKRCIAIGRDALLKIPIRIGIAAGSPKVAPILGALRGKLVNILVTDALTAQAVLELDQQKESDQFAEIKILP